MHFMMQVRGLRLISAILVIGPAGQPYRRDQELSNHASPDFTDTKCLLDDGLTWMEAFRRIMSSSSWPRHAAELSTLIGPSSDPTTLYEARHMALNPDRTTPDHRAVLGIASAAVTMVVSIVLPVQN